METSSLVELAQKALMLVLMLSAPVVLVALAVGLVIGLLQAASQIQEFTLSFVPKVLAVLVTLALVAPWIGEHLARFAQAIFSTTW